MEEQIKINYIVLKYKISQWCQTDKKLVDIWPLCIIIGNHTDFMFNSNRTWIILELC